MSKSSVNVDERPPMPETIDSGPLDLEKLKALAARYTAPMPEGLSDWSEMNWHDDHRKTGVKLAEAFPALLALASTSEARIAELAKRLADTGKWAEDLCKDAAEDEARIADLTDVAQQAIARAERAEAREAVLRKALAGFVNAPRKSIDRDNIEFNVTVTCFIIDTATDALNNKPE